MSVLPLPEVSGHGHEERGRPGMYVCMYIYVDISTTVLSICSSELSGCVFHICLHFTGSKLQSRQISWMRGWGISSSWIWYCITSQENWYLIHTTVKILQFIGMYHKHIQKVTSQWTVLLSGERKRLITYSIGLGKVWMLSYECFSRSMLHL